MKNIKLIVGLANPGVKYSLTRHNAGSWYIKLLAKKYRHKLKEKKQFFGYTSQLNIDKNKFHLLVPTTFMNLSGKSVLALANFYRIEINEILVAHDDLDLLPGIIKTKLGGSNGGHNGLKDIQKKFGNNPNFYRLRIGIGHPGDKKKVVQFVLSNPTEIEQEMINKSIEKFLYCSEMLIQDGVENDL